MKTTPTLAIAGLQFPVSPIWHDDALWFTDQFARRLHRATTLDGSCEAVAYVPGQPSGIAARTDGDVLVVSMFDDVLLAFDGERLRKVADLGGLRLGPSNDIVTDGHNRAYVSGHGFDLFYSQTLDAPDTALLMVDADDRVSVAAEGLKMPNGLALSADGAQLFVSETAANRVSAFDVDAAGGLSGHRIHVDLGHRTPDGIALDGRGRLWVACPPQHEYVCIDADGSVCDVVATPGRRAIGCTIGGTEGTTLVMTTAHTTLEGYFAGTSVGAVETIEVE